MSRIVGSVAVTALIGATFYNHAAMSEELRVKTTVFVADEEEPVNESLTLFQGGVVYDFLPNPPQVAVFRPATAGKHGRFILLDDNHQVMTEVDAQRIETLVGKLRTIAAQKKDPVSLFMAAPKFEVSRDVEQGTYSFQSKHLIYDIESMQVERPETAQLYREFSDWYARLNAVDRSGVLPFPRMVVSERLAQDQRIPKRVRLQIPSYDLDVRAEHEVNLRLSKQDRNKIDLVHDQLASFRQVDLDEYRDLTTDQTRTARK